VNGRQICRDVPAHRVTQDDRRAAPEASEQLVKVRCEVLTRVAGDRGGTQSVSSLIRSDDPIAIFITLDQVGPCFPATPTAVQAEDRREGRCRIPHEDLDAVGADDPSFERVAFLHQDDAVWKAIR
jgi:hypothetical protein